MRVINSFTDVYFFLSNFYLHPVDGYPSSEHYYQAMKTDDMALRKRFSLEPGTDEEGKPLSVLTAGQAKRMGRVVPLREHWEEMKVPMMEMILRIKFSDPHLKTLLIATGPDDLVEGNNWHDNFWGDCNCVRCADKEKHNWLGKLLMAIRKDFRNEMVHE